MANINLPDPATELAPLRIKWGWIVLLGLVYVIAGTVALGSIVTATAVSVFIVGAMMIVAGIGEIIGAFQLTSWGKAMLWALVGALYVLAGFVTLQNPALAAVLLTFILGFSLIASGVVRLFLAYSLRHEQSWVWVALSGIITVLLGIVILAKWPFSSVYILGLFLGVDLVIAGFGWIGLGFALRRAPALGGNRPT